MPDATPLLEVEGLSVSFGGRSNGSQAVRGVSLAVGHGEALGVVGESGSGKSMTALAIMGLLPPDATARGAVRFRGEDLLGMSAARARRLRGTEIGVVFQDPLSSLNPVLTVGFQIGEVLRKHAGLSRSAARERARELLDLVGISNPGARLGQYPHELSGGMRQRAMIAAALATEPALLIADEPTTALDVTVQAQVLELLAELRERLGMAIVLISHDLGVVAGVTDRTVVMYAGAVVEEAGTVDLLAHPKHPYTEGLIRCVPRLDMPRSEPLEPIAGAPLSARAAVEGCRFRTRCPYEFEPCGEVPPLLAARPGQRAACWLLSEAGSRPR